jgi:alpha-ketoglutaric semialdehyde dehydrogenase
MSVSRKFNNLINGEWRNPLTDQWLENVNPARPKEVLGLYPQSSAADVQSAVDAAVEAYPAWRRTPAPKRAELLFRVARRLQENKEALAVDMTNEMGKVLSETRGDLQEAIDMAYFMAGEGRRLHGQTTPSELASKFAMSIRQPVGVCGLITPWNFPMAIPSWKIFPALICGDTVVIKPASDTPHSCHHLVRILVEEGVPRGVVNLVFGSGATAGAALLDDPRVNLVSFTGSTDTGKRVGTSCAAGMKRCHLEMGGKNVIMVMEDADIPLAVQGALWGGFGTTGQRCTAASRVVVQKDVYEDFLEMFVERARGIRIGNGLEPTTQMGPLINRAALQKVNDYVQVGIREGAHLACGGGIPSGGTYADGFFFEPTVFSGVHPGMRIAQEEIFGPVVAVIPADGFEHAIQIANGVQYGLSASIYTQDVNRAFVAMREVDTGIFYVNAPTIGAEIQLPFGGTRHSGNGHREAGTAALDTYSEWKSVFVDYSGRLQRAQIDP